MGWATKRRLALLAMLGAASIAPAGPAQAASCYDAVRSAERQYRIPKGLLGAIATVESQMAGRPQQLALNIEGQAHYPDNLQGALGAIHKAVASGQTGVAVGCMQIRYDFHQRHFRSAQDMLDPEINVQYAAAFLKRLYQAFGSWDRAVSYYNVGQDTLYLPYLCRVAARLEADIGSQILDAGWRQCGFKVPVGSEARRPRPAIITVAADRGWDGLAVVEPKVPGERFRPVGEPQIRRGLSIDEETPKAVRPAPVDETDTVLSPAPAERSLSPASQTIATKPPVPLIPRVVARESREPKRAMPGPEGPTRRATLDLPPPPAPGTMLQFAAEAREADAPHFAHLASYGDLGSALTGWQVLGRVHPAVFQEYGPVIHEVKVSDDRTAYRLLVGAFPSRADAEAFCRRLADSRQYCQARQ